MGDVRPVSSSASRISAEDGGEPRPRFSGSSAISRITASDWSQIGEQSRSSKLDELMSWIVSPLDPAPSTPRRVLISIQFCPLHHGDQTDEGVGSCGGGLPREALCACRAGGFLHRRQRHSSAETVVLILCGIRQGTHFITLPGSGVPCALHSRCSCAGPDVLLVFVIGICRLCELATLLPAWTVAASVPPEPSGHAGNESCLNAGHPGLRGNGQRLEILKGIDFQPRRVLRTHGSFRPGKSDVPESRGGLDTPTSGDILFGRQKPSAPPELSGTNITASGASVSVSSTCRVEFTALENVCVPAHRGSERKGLPCPRGVNFLRPGGGDRLKHLPRNFPARNAPARALMNHPQRSMFAG